MSKPRFYILCLFFTALLLAGGIALAQSPYESSAPAPRPFSAWSNNQRELTGNSTPASPGALNQIGQLTQTPDTTLSDIFKAISTRQKELNLNLWFPGSVSLSDTEIAQGAAVAEGIALRSGNVPVIVTSEPGIVPGRFNVVIGNVEQLHGILQPGELRDASNGFLILRRLPNRPDTQILLITGRTPAGLESAILTLGIARERLPGASTAAIQSVLLPKSPPFLRREPLRSDTIYSFQQLQETGASLLLLPNGNLRVEFMLPGDFIARSGERLKLDLHYTIKNQIFRSTDRISVVVNGKANAQNGAILPGRGNDLFASVELPTDLFAPGRNVFEITFSGAGTLGGTGDFQILSDSTLTLPLCTAPPTLPNLQITSQTVYPLIGQPDGSEIAVSLADREKETIESAWTFLAKLAQMSNTLLHGAEFTTGAYVGPKHLITIGTPESLPEAVRKQIPNAIFSNDPIAVPTPDQSGINLKDFLRSVRSDVEENFLPLTPSSEKKEAPESIEEVAAHHERGYLGCFPPKENEHGWLLILTAQTASILNERTNALVTPEFWDRISGENLYWGRTPESVHAYVDPKSITPDRYSRNQAGWFEIEMPLGERYHVTPWMIASAITLVLLILTTYNALIRLQRSGGYRT